MDFVKSPDNMENKRNLTLEEHKREILCASSYFEQMALAIEYGSVDLGWSNQQFLIKKLPSDPTLTRE